LIFAVEPHVRKNQDLTPSTPSKLLVWVPAVSMMLVSFISYVDRNTLALLAPTILREMDLSGEQYGLVVSAFSIAYMISNPLWGRWLDRFGLRWGMTAAVTAWTLASVSHALTRGLIGLAAARAALGFGEGATFPGGLRTVVQTLPLEHRSRGVALAYSGGSLGAVVTPIIITPIVVMWSWRAAFWFTGLIGFAWVVLWGVVSRFPAVRHVPPQHDERAKSRATSPRFTDPRLWSFIAAYALGALPLGFILYVAAIYLNQAMGKSQVEIGRVLWIPPLGWEMGYFFWGYVTDRGLRAGHSSLRLHRRLMVLALVFSLPLALTPRINSLPLVMSEMFLAMFVAAGFIILSVSYATSVYSIAHSGFIAGVGAGAWSAVVAIIMPVFGRMFDRQLYEAAFLLATGLPVAGFVLWWLLSVRRG
jgi:ACS family hexuronate transporter-like MFS transporter